MAIRRIELWMIPALPQPRNSGRTVQSCRPGYSPTASELNARDMLFIKSESESEKNWPWNVQGMLCFWHIGKMICPSVVSKKISCSFSNPSRLVPCMYMSMIHDQIASIPAMIFCHGSIVQKKQLISCSFPFWHLFATRLRSCISTQRTRVPFCRRRI